ncbi:hypothetical protein [Neptunomonas japonica]|uniref:hypothetical protein n=1 Tax=Neptunomonas japonica TaxID=417574 RepID=UPI0003FC4825|nr:hypothetical protein [Neptunomonas japonica]
MKNKILDLSKNELDGALSALPKDDLNKFILFTETMRILDYWSVFRDILPNKYSLSIPDFEILKLGWNLALEHLYVPVKTSGFPIKESTEETRIFATSLLHKFGRSVLLNRTYDMLNAGFVSAEIKGSKIVIRVAEYSGNQFMDNLEFNLLSGMEQNISNSLGSYLNGWHIGEYDDPLTEMNMPGAYFLQDSKKEFKKYHLDDVDELMGNLVFPWDSGNGVMMGYDALPELDNHFFSIAVEGAISWRNDVGIHPSVQLNGVTGSELTLIVAVVSSLHMKHVGFALSAMKKNKTISIPQSLTIWTKKSELIDSIQALVNLDRDTIKRGVDSITLTPFESVNINGHTTPFIPMLVDLGNGMLLRPVSSLIRNPFISTSTLQGWRTPNITDILSQPREDWMRDDLYYLFKGTKYKVIDGNIKIRNGNKVVTDIDAAILDRTTGELALFQIKWQDYYTNDIKKLRSKAKNFIEEIDSWSFKVSSWIEENGLQALVDTLRLKLPKNKKINKVYLFGLSKTSARMAGYGYNLNSNNIAVCNWPMFVRIRFEIGASKRVFHDLYTEIKKNKDNKIKAIPLSVEISSNESVIEFIDLWNDFSNYEDGE